MDDRTDDNDEKNSSSKKTTGPTKVVTKRKAATKSKTSSKKTASSKKKTSSKKRVGKEPGATTGNFADGGDSEVQTIKSEAMMDDRTDDNDEKRDPIEEEQPTESNQISQETENADTLGNEDGDKRHNEMKPQMVAEGEKENDAVEVATV